MSLTTQGVYPSWLVVVIAAGIGCGKHESADDELRRVVDAIKGPVAALRGFGKDIAGAPTGKDIADGASRSSRSS